MKQVFQWCHAEKALIPIAFINRICPITFQSNYGKLSKAHDYASPRPDVLPFVSGGNYSEIGSKGDYAAVYDNPMASPTTRGQLLIDFDVSPPEYQVPRNGQKGEDAPEYLVPRNGQKREDAVYDNPNANQAARSEAMYDNPMQLMQRARDQEAQAQGEL